jgi:hypothetical protein
VPVKVVVVYESFWGNTAAIARAVAEGFGPEACALSTAEAVPPALAGADLIVAGSPVLGFALPSEGMRANMATTFGAPRPADLSGPSMRSWLEELAPGHGRCATFETAFRWSPGGATSALGRGLEHAGYRPIVKGRRFVVAGKFGPLRDGELDRACQWGAELARAAAALPG